MLSPALHCGCLTHFSHNTIQFGHRHATFQQISDCYFITKIKHIHFTLLFGHHVFFGRQIFTKLSQRKQQITEKFKQKNNTWG
jgi:hypothetical protein